MRHQVLLNLPSEAWGKEQSFQPHHEVEMSVTLSTPPTYSSHDVMCSIRLWHKRDQTPNKGKEAIEGSTLHQADGLPGLSMLDVWVHAQGRVSAHFSPQGSCVSLLY